MVRFWAFAVLALLPSAAFGQAGGKGEIVTKIQGKLTQDDPKDKKTNSPSQIRALTMNAGYVYTIDMVSSQLDSFLRLEDKAGNQLDEDDDSGGDLNARMIFNCTKDGEYKIICTVLGPVNGGAYSLTVKKTAGTAKTATAHDALMGKKAPDFQADFVLNGKALKLSDLKGKVVLLEFCDVRLEACVAAVKRLSGWSKDLKEAGLEVVAVTFYYHDIGQLLRFDKDAGKLARADSADKKTDREALQQFAAHHKLEYLLMILAKDHAHRVFDAYGVNGVPQAVVVDRQGTIRTFRMDDEKGSQQLESELKKLLEER